MELKLGQVENSGTDNSFQTGEKNWFGCNSRLVVKQNTLNRTNFQSNFCLFYYGLVSYFCHLKPIWERFKLIYLSV